MQKLTNQIFLERAKLKHSDRYTYIDNYTLMFVKMQIECKQHGIFKQTPQDHLRGVGCRKCGVIKAHENFKKDTQWFIKKANKKHSNKYDYSKTNYLGSQPKVIITCQKHGDFQQKAYSHLSGKGCKKCNSSKGEIEVRNWLISNNIIFIEQKRFKSCRHIKPLAFDFYLPYNNLLIEFDGEQHFSIAKKFDKNWGNQKLAITKLRDSIKNNWCLKNNIDLLRIKFTQNIHKRLKEKIYGTI